MKYFVSYMAVVKMSISSQTLRNSLASPSEHYYTNCQRRGQALVSSHSGSGVQCRLTVARAFRYILS